MDNARDAGIVALLIIIATCVAIYLVGATEPTGALIDFLFPRL